MPPINKVVQIDTAHKIIDDLVSSKYYGEVQFKFESGNIVHLRYIRNAKIEDEAVRMLGDKNAASTEGHRDIPGE